MGITTDYESYHESLNACRVCDKLLSSSQIVLCDDCHATKRYCFYCAADLVGNDPHQPDCESPDDERADDEAAAQHRVAA